MLTPRDRLVGDVLLSGDRIEVSGKSVRWEDVVYLSTNEGLDTFSEPHRLHLKNGESWRVRLDRLTAGRCSVRSSLFGEKMVGEDRIEAIDFIPNPAISEADEAERLYRARDKPIPGKLLWIDAEKVAISSPLGVLKIPRKGLARYRFAKASWRAPIGESIDELSLIDGSVFRGKAVIRGTTIRLEHPVLGELSLPIAALRSLVRHRPGFMDLAASAPLSARTHALLSERVYELGWRSLRTDARTNARFRIVKGLRLSPRSFVRYAMPDTQGKTAVLRTLLAPSTDSRGDLIVAIRVDDATVLEKQVGSGSALEFLSVELPAGKELLVELRFGTKLLFPCAVVLGNPHVIARSEAPSTEEGQ